MLTTHSAVLETFDETSQGAESPQIEKERIDSVSKTHSETPEHSIEHYARPMAGDPIAEPKKTTSTAQPDSDAPDDSITALPPMPQKPKGPQFSIRPKRR